MGEALALFSAFMFALAGIMIRRGASHMQNTAGHLLSVLVNVILNCTALVLRILVGPPISLSWTGMGFFIAGGVFTTFLGRILWMRSIQHIGPSRAGSFKMAQLVLIFVAAVLLLGEEATLVGVLGAGLVLLGLIFLTYERSEDGYVGDSRTGISFGWASAVSFAIGNLSRKAGMMAWPEALVGAAIGACIAGLATLALPHAARRLREGLAAPGGLKGAAWFAGVGISTSASQFSLFAALGLSPVWAVNLIASTEILLVALLSLVLLRGREVLGQRLWASLFLVTAGVAAITLR